VSSATRPLAQACGRAASAGIRLGTENGERTPIGLVVAVLVVALLVALAVVALVVAGLVVGLRASRLLINLGRGILDRVRGLLLIVFALLTLIVGANGGRRQRRGRSGR